MRIYTHKSFAAANGLNSFEHVTKIGLEDIGFKLLGEFEKKATETKSVRELVEDIVTESKVTTVVYQATTRMKSVYRIWIYAR